MLLLQVSSSGYIAILTSMEYRGAGGGAPCVGVKPHTPAPHPSGNRYIWFLKGDYSALKGCEVGDLSMLLQFFSSVVSGLLISSPT
jgi:hypothetical protein